MSVHVSSIYHNIMCRIALVIGQEWNMTESIQKDVQIYVHIYKSCLTNNYVHGKDVF